MELEGYIEKIIFRNEENGYTVLSVISNEDADDAQVCVGYIEGAAQGLYIHIEGEEVEHHYYEKQCVSCHRAVELLLSWSSLK